MKKILLSLILSLAVAVSYSQTVRPVYSPFSLQQFGSSGTITRINGVLYPVVGYMPALWTDTATANASSLNIKNIPFFRISTTSDGKSWVRNYATTAWLEELNSGSAGTGTVTSVGLSLPNIFTVSGSPVTTSGTLTGTLASQSQNLVFASPNGSSGTPSFRALVAADLPGTVPTPISSLTAATGTNTLDIGDYPQIWTANTLGANTGFKISSTSTAANSNAQKLFELSLSGANSNSGQLSYALYLVNSHSGTNSSNTGVAAYATNGASNNTAGYFSSTGASVINYGIISTALGATTNIGGYFSGTEYGIIVPSSGGSVGIGTSTPTSLLHVNGVGQFGTAGSTIGQINISGNTSGTISILPQAAAGTYNFNLPSTAGTSGYFLTSAGGGSSPMTWTQNNFITGSGTANQIAFFNGTSSITSLGRYTIGGSDSYPEMLIGGSGTVYGSYLKLKDVLGGYGGLKTDSGPLTIFGGAYQDVQIQIGSSTAARFYRPTTYNTIDLNGVITLNETTILSNTKGIVNIDRTYGSSVSGSNAHGFTDGTVFRQGNSAFNSFGSFVTVGSSSYNQDHYAAFQNVFTKDSSNTITNIYGFANAVSTVSGGTVTNYYGFYHFNPDTSGTGVITNQYGVYIPSLTEATNNYGAYFGSKVGIGITAPTSLLHVVPTQTTGIGIAVASSTTTSGSIMDITGTSTALAANNEGLNIGISGANGTSGITATGARISVTNTNGTSGTNVGLDVTASGATTANNAIRATGNVLVEGTGNVFYGRWKARVDSTTSSATPTINTDNVDVYKLTAQAADITSFTTNLSGTPNDMDILEIEITGTAARAITWGTSFVSTTVTLPTTTTSTTTLTVVLQYYKSSSYGNNKWHCVNYY